MPGEDGKPHEQKDDGDQDVREVHDSFHCIASFIAELHASDSARSRSEIRSATSSIPTEIRTSPSATPCARRVSAGIEAWVIAAGSSISDSTPPRLSASVNSRVRSTTRRAGSGPPFTSKVNKPQTPDLSPPA